MSKSISQTNQAGSLAGNEQVLVSQLSTTVKIEGTTISAQASDQSFNDSGAGLLAAGFQVDRKVNVIGFTGGGTVNNIYSAKITALTANKMTIGGADGAVIVDASAGDTVTITQWVSGRADYPPAPGKLVIKTISTTTYSIIASDLGKHLVFTHADGCAVTIPDSLGAGFHFTGRGTQNNITFAGSGSASVVGVDGYDLEVFAKSTFSIVHEGSGVIALAGYQVETVE